MATPKGQLYRNSLVLLIWLQKFEGSISAEYNVDLQEINFLASNLSPQECYDFYTRLSHRKAIRGGISVYAQKEKMRQLPCINLLATWLTDPEEAAFRSHENIELKLRKIGRKDLARWIVERIESTLQKKRRLDYEDIYRRIEESEQNKVIVINRIGGRITPSTSLEDNQMGIDSENVIVDVSDNSCIFWKIFFSVIVVLLLMILFACFYRFLYAKLRLIFRRFDHSKDRKCCLPEQTYGTTSGLDFNTKKSCNYLNCSTNSRKRTKEARHFAEKINIESSEKFSSANESNDDLLSNIIEEKRALLLNLTNKLTKIRSSTDESFSDSQKKHFNFKIKSDEKSFSKMKEKINSSVHFDKTSNHNFWIQNAFLKHKRSLNSRSEKIFTWEKNGRRKFNKIDFNRFDRVLSRSFSDAQLNFSKSTSSRIFLSKESTKNKTKRKTSFFSSKLKIQNLQDESPKWTSCSCNEISQIIIPSAPSNIPSKKKLTNSEFQQDKTCPDNYLRYSRSEKESELSETYNELGMLFSEEMKRQWRPCRRKYCPLSRNLRANGKAQEHDKKKCRTRFRATFGHRMIRVDERPACSTADICPDTYDELKLMRATRDKRESVARSIVERRKHFLDQPCLSPVNTENSFDY